MPRQHPTDISDERVRPMLAGEPVLEFFDSGVSMQSPHRWKHQELIDVWLAEDVDSTESAALRAAHKRSRDLEQEF